MQTFGWADKIAQELLKRNKETYVFHGMWTPSGFFHIGNARSEVFTPYAAKHALESYNKKCIQNFIIDDFDVIRKIPLGLNIAEKDYEEYLGYPCALAKSPLPGFKTWAEAFVSNVKEFLPKYGIKVNYISAYETYKAGIFNYAIKISLDNAKKIVEIWNKIANANKPESFLPIQVLCPKCKKLTTEAKEWLADAEEVSFVCKNPNCKYEGVISPYNGNAKLHWRVHWAAHWHYYKVDFESGGKDHFAAGGSVETSRIIQKEIYGSEPPLGFAYEWISIKGQGEFASSLGRVVTLKEMLEIYTPEVIRYLFASTRPKVCFNISFDLDVLKIYEDFDKCERIYFGEEKTGEKEKAKQSRIYELSCISKIPKKMPYQPGFRHLTTILQIKGLNIEKAIGFFEKELKDEFDKERLKERAVCAKNWLEKYAPEEFRFAVQDKVKVKLGAKEKKVLKLLGKRLEEREWGAEDLHEEIYILCKNNDLEVRDFFKAAYKVLINKEKGPRLASFILEIGRKKVASLLEKIK